MSAVLGGFGRCFLSRCSNARLDIATTWPNFGLRRYLRQWNLTEAAIVSNKDEVPDYYNVITSPMDLSTVEERLHQDQYITPKNFVDDLKLIFSNCRKYNDETTVYTKCAVKLEKYMWSLVKDIPEWHELLEWVIDLLSLILIF